MVQALVHVKLAVYRQAMFPLSLEAIIIATESGNPAGPQTIEPILIHYGMVNSVMDLSLLVAPPQLFLGFIKY